MILPRLYRELAEYWPLLSPPDDYVQESALLRDLVLQQHQQVRRKPTLLELGVGGGHTLSHIAGEVEATGVDLSPEMLRQCHQLVPSLELIEGDLRYVRLERTFDLVFLHDAADYLLDVHDLDAALETIRVHLAPGGIAAIAPTYVAETFVPHEFSTDQQSAGDELTISFLSYVHDPNPNDTEFEMIIVYLINRCGSVQVEEDRHRCGLLPTGTWLDRLRQAHLDAEVRDDEMWRLFVARHAPGH